ncbi:hypothetical protein LTR37_011065 [Vermiconidia calcicola]|uniref:Uncharacterized protein n=1 Tax=Vermiconidia calcicola TaxID=1690605 RepID=A0ACC3N383_9PEZI|nr:hypothetical protein LTR37_011065 [Vermiconidia calcicola]
MRHFTVSVLTSRSNDPLAPSSRQSSPGSQDSPPDTDRTDHSLSRPLTISRTSTFAEGDREQADAPPAPGRVGGGQSSNTRTKERYLDIHQLRPSGQVPVTNTNGYPEFSFGVQWDPSPPYSPTGYDSPTNEVEFSSGLPYYQPQSQRARHLSNASYLGSYTLPHTTRSPVSAGSSTVHLPQWGGNAHDPVYQHLNTSSGSESSVGNNFGIYNSDMADQQILLGTFGSSGVLTPEDRDFMETDDLVVPSNTSQGSSLDFSLDDSTYTNEERYLSAYWHWVHAYYPVVHRPTFSIQNVSPLLRAAMLALGAQALGDAADKGNARIMHERCTKVLKKRTLNGWHSFRVCDMQAVVLIEVYSIFKSRRPPLQFSKFFEEVYAHLANDPATINPTSTPEASIQTIRPDYFDDDFATSFMVAATCKQRLLLSCYILDQHHAALFGRQRTSCFSGAGTDLPFPASQTIWDDVAAPQVSDEPKHVRLWDALEGGSSIGSEQNPYDVFQSVLIMACVCASNTDMSGLEYTRVMVHDVDEIVLATMEQSARIKLAYHTLQLCKHTPIRELLAVAGESWVMAEKLSRKTDYTAAQIEARQWAKGSQHAAMEFVLEREAEPVEKAMEHALKILELHQSHPKTGLLFQEWSIYLASIVIWARAYVTSDVPRRGPRLSVPQPTAPRLTEYELYQTLVAVMAAGPVASISTDQAQNVLLWTQMKIKKVDVPHNCGLTNGALDVLGKLATRGSEEGWFG